MTREEEIKQGAKYSANGTIDDELAEMFFIRGAEWAGQNPRKGLWDAEKVVKWILENADKHIWYDETENECGITDNFIEDLKKAMED